MNQRGYGTFSSGYRLNKLGQVVSPQNGGNDLASIKLNKVKVERPLLSTTATVAVCSILDWVPARTRPLNTFRTCVSKSSDASFSTMKRQNMNKRAGSLETTLLKRIMLLPTAIKNVKSSGNHGY